MSMREPRSGFPAGQSAAAPCDAGQPFHAGSPPSSRPLSRELGREELQRKLDALAGDVRAKPSHSDRPARPDDARAEYAEFVLPAAESGKKPEALKVVIGLGVDPRADPTVVAMRVRDSVNAMFTGESKTGWGWKPIAALGFFALSGVIGWAFLSPGASPANEPVKPVTAAVPVGSTGAAAQGPSLGEAPAASVPVKPMQAAPKKPAAASPAGAGMTRAQPRGVSGKPPIKHRSRKPQSNEPLGKGPVY